MKFFREFTTLKLCYEQIISPLDLKEHEREYVPQKIWLDLRMIKFIQQRINCEDEPEGTLLYFDSRNEMDEVYVITPYEEVKEMLVELHSEYIL